MSKKKKKKKILPDQRKIIKNSLSSIDKSRDTTLKKVFLRIQQTELETETVYQDRLSLIAIWFLPKSSCILRRSRESHAATNWILLISFHLCTIEPAFSITRRKSSLSMANPRLFAFKLRFQRDSTRLVLLTKAFW